jgi:membrane protein YdbS with pleckstrin-like domain
VTVDDSSAALTTEEILAIEGPHESLMTYYALSSLAAGPFFPFVLVPLYFRYHTMRYRFSDEGVSMSWGILFRKEINLTFARIQDIHLTSNFVERWLGLARIQIQTASGSSKAEMTIEGVREFGPLRDFLYFRMRGARGLVQPQASAGASSKASDASVTGDLGEVAAALREAVGELREIRTALERRAGGSDNG